jgi:hypothetical protein
MELGLGLERGVGIGPDPGVRSKSISLHWFVFMKGGPALEPAAATRMLSLSINLPPFASLSRDRISVPFRAEERSEKVRSISTTEGQGKEGWGERVEGGEE